ncbi:MAG: alpha/beta hydrolase [Candidatus Hydrogenedentota bacterium]|nr:MAG: alpha/beta hydrolase [Candidatus Hydrogenedentota bacterium]
MKPILASSILGNHPKCTLLILHGLFASRKNYLSTAKFLSQTCTVHALDLRNHGESFHGRHSIQEMVEDVKIYCDYHNIKNPILLGHSMGGMVAMAFALRYCEKIHAIIVADIAPKHYSFPYEKELQALEQDFSSCTNRKEVEEKMKPFIPDASLRQFLMMNIQRNQQGKFYNVLDTKEIRHWIEHKEELEYKGQCNKPALFIRATLSPFTNKSDEAKIKELFPNAQIQMIEADHWLHFSAADKFNTIVLNFLQSQVLHE